MVVVAAVVMVVLLLLVEQVKAEALGDWPLSALRCFRHALSPWAPATRLRVLLFFVLGYQWHWVAV